MFGNRNDIFYFGLHEACSLYYGLLFRAVATIDVSS
jgi:hypothetical protein